MKPVYLLALLPTALLLNGCDDAESEVCRYYIQNDIDKSNFDSAITRLSDESCQNTYPEKQHLVDLSSAYLGKAGLPLPVIMSAMIEDDDSSEEFTFDTFVDEITESASPSALLDLHESRSALDTYLDNQSCREIETPTSAEDTVCLMTGFIDVLKTTMAIDVMTNGLNSLTTQGIESRSSFEDNPTLLRSTCALKYSYEHKNDDDFVMPYVRCENGVTFEDSEAVTFRAADGSEKTYNHLSISYNGVSDYFLESESLGSTIFTQDYCQLDYSVCDAIEANVCYSCPLSQGEEDLNLQDYLLDSLNSGFDSIEAVIINSVDDEDGEIQQAINDFKEDIKSGGCESVPEGENCFTMDDIIDYLNNK